MFEMIGNPDKQADMEKYMRQQFQFLGLQTPERKAQSKALIQQSKKLPIRSVHSLIADLYDRVEREYQYVAIDVAYANVTRFTYSDLKELTQYIQRKSWWDTVDSWRKIYGKFVVLHSEQKGAVFNLFYKHPNMWMRRISIILQLHEKETLDTHLLTLAIDYDIDTDEFFIQKAIGWALRNYSKYNPFWVSMFVENRDLSKLAKKEASKYLKEINWEENFFDDKL